MNIKVGTRVQVKPIPRGDHYQQYARPGVVEKHERPGEWWVRYDEPWNHNTSGNRMTGAVIPETWMTVPDIIIEEDVFT